MRSRISKVALAGAFVASAAFGQTTIPEQAPVKRPDGTVVHPQVPVQRAPSISTTDGRADERERTRQQTQQAAEERIDQSRREREAANERPARQVAPTTLPR